MSVELIESMTWLNQIYLSKNLIENSCMNRIYQSKRSFKLFENETS